MLYIIYNYFGKLFLFKLKLKKTAKRKWPSMQRWQCPIDHGAFKKLFLFKYELDINVYDFQNCLFSIRVYIQKWLGPFYGRE